MQSTAFSPKPSTAERVARGRRQALPADAGGRRACGVRGPWPLAAMTDYSEEQRNELEALESIYPDSFTGEPRSASCSAARPRRGDGGAVRGAACRPFSYGFLGVKVEWSVGCSGSLSVLCRLRAWCPGASVPRLGQSVSSTRRAAIEGFVREISARSLLPTCAVSARPTSGLISSALTSLCRLPAAFVYCFNLETLLILHFYDKATWTGVL